MRNSKQVIEKDTVIVASKEQISSEVAGESVILNLKSGVYFGLNSVGLCVWNLIEQPKTFADIGNALLEKYDVEVEQCNHDLRNLLEALQTQGLIEVSKES